MAHTREKRWDSIRNPDGSVQEGVNQMVGQRANQVLRSVYDGEELYLQLIELYTFVGATDQLLADQLFKEQIAARGETVANAEEVSMAEDLKNATVALHQLYLCMSGEAVTAGERAAALRRMI